MKDFLGVLLLCLVAVPLNAEGPVRATQPGLFGTVVDINGVFPGPTGEPSTLLYKASNRAPLLAPDGHQISLGEWTAFSGTATIKCTEQGTHATIHLQGLIPHGLYSVWTFAFDDQSGVALGSLTSLSRIPAAYTANQQGRIAVNAIIPAGPLSVRGAISNCLLNHDEHAFVIIYHSDGQTYGPVPGPASVSINQLFFDTFE